MEGVRPSAYGKGSVENSEEGAGWLSLSFMIEATRSAKEGEELDEMEPEEGRTGEAEMTEIKGRTSVGLREESETKLCEGGAGFGRTRAR